MSSLIDILFHPLTLVTFFPLVGVLVILFLRQEQKNLVRWVASQRIIHRN